MKIFSQLCVLLSLVTSSTLVVAQSEEDFPIPPSMDQNWVISPPDHNSTLVHYDAASDTLFSFEQYPASITKLNPSTGAEMGNNLILVSSPDDDASLVKHFVAGSNFFIVMVELLAASDAGLGRLMRVNLNGGDDMTIEWDIPMESMLAVEPFLDNRFADNSPPILSPDGLSVYYNGRGANLLAYSTVDGSLRWNNDQIGANLGPLTMFGSSTIFAAKTFYADGELGDNQKPITLYEFDASAGTIRSEWSWVDECPVTTCRGNVRHAPVVSPDANFVYIIEGYSDSVGIMKFSANNIAAGPFWTANQGTYGGWWESSGNAPAISADGLTLFIHGQAPTAVNTANGSEKWVVWREDLQLSGTLMDDIVVKGDEVWYFMRLVEAVAFDQADGTPIKRTRTDTPVDRLNPVSHAFSDDSLFMVDGETSSSSGIPGRLASYALAFPEPTTSPTVSPTVFEAPTVSPTAAPTVEGNPTASPSGAPTSAPTDTPSAAFHISINKLAWMVVLGITGLYGFA